MSKIVMGIQVDQRTKDATKVQELLTKFGCYIKTRLGLNQTFGEENSCGTKGLILLEFIDDVEDKVETLEKELGKIDSVEAKKMVILNI